MARAAQIDPFDLSIATLFKATARCTQAVVSSRLPSSSRISIVLAKSSQHLKVGEF